MDGRKGNTVYVLAGEMMGFANSRRITKPIPLSEIKSGSVSDFGSRRRLWVFSRPIRHRALGLVFSDSIGTQLETQASKKASDEA